MNEVIIILGAFGTIFIVPILLLVGLLAAFRKRPALPQIISLVGVIMLLLGVVMSFIPESTNYTSSTDKELTRPLSLSETKQHLQSWGFMTFSIGFALTGIQQRKTKQVEPVN